MHPIPPEPDVPSSQRARGDLTLRYEDVSQDGRLNLLSIPFAIGEVVWRRRLAEHEISKQLRRAGILPVLSRLSIEGGDGPFSIRHPFTGEGGFELAHTVGEDGAVNRILLTTFVSLAAPRSHLHGPRVDGAGELAFAGRCVAENVFTRLFAPPGQRRVVRLEGVDAAGTGLEPVPSQRRAWQPPESLLELPEGARALDEDLTPDDAPVVFGLGHTDPNQHVNSQVYPRLFEEAALRRLAARGESGRLLARRSESAFRKPCFAGEAFRIHLRAFVTSDGHAGAIGCFLPEGAPVGAEMRPHTYLRVLFAK